jgi:serine/threonine-protein kinase RsbW
MRTSPASREPGADTVELRIAARAENVALARLALSGVAAAAGAPPDVVADLKLAVSEVCTNAVQHAYAGRSGESEGQVVLRFIVAERKLRVEVEDEGSGFELETRRGSNDDEAGGGPGDNLGMGLGIVRSVTDELEIESGGRGSRITFSKKF